jgi:hypothetical protein
VVSQILIAPLAGLLTTVAGCGWAFAANAASFAISALLLAGLRACEAPPPVTAVSIGAHAGEALRLIGRDRLLRALAVAQMLAALSAGATSALLVVLAAQWLHTSGGGYGLLLAAIAAGALAGPILLTQLACPAPPAHHRVQRLRAARPGRPRPCHRHRPALRARGAGVLRDRHLRRQCRLRHRHPVACPGPPARSYVQRIRPDLAVHAPGQPVAGRVARRHRRHPRRLLPRRRPPGWRRPRRADPGRAP